MYVLIDQNFNRLIEPYMVTKKNHLLFPVLYVFYLLFTLFFV